MKSELKTRKHHFEMIIDENSRVLILGSLPSLMSEKNNFYYGNPFNRFWKIIGTLFNEDNLINQTNEYKKEVILKNHLALYDVIKECKIKGSSDNDIVKDSIVVMNLKEILNKYNIKLIALNGNKAYKIFKKYYPEYLNIAIKMPSTSSANARYSLEKLIDKWKIIKNLEKI